FITYLLKLRGTIPNDKCGSNLDVKGLREAA
ncbi:MAG: hypothetical protein ACJA13_004274, partial [Paraglaciecola sp.]